MEFGELLKKTLKENKVKITHLSSLIGMNRMAVYAVFNGEKSGTKNTIDYATKVGVPVVRIKG